MNPGSKKGLVVDVGKCRDSSGSLIRTPSRKGLWGRWQNTGLLIIAVPHVIHIIAMVFRLCIAGFSNLSFPLLPFPGPAFPAPWQCVLRVLRTISDDRQLGGHGHRSLHRRYLHHFLRPFGLWLLRCLPHCAHHSLHYHRHVWPYVSLGHSSQRGRSPSFNHKKEYGSGMRESVTKNLRIQILK